MVLKEEKHFVGLNEDYFTPVKDPVQQALGTALTML